MMEWGWMCVQQGGKKSMCERETCLGHSSLFGSCHFSMTSGSCLALALTFPPLFVCVFMLYSCSLFTLQSCKDPVFCCQLHVTCSTHKSSSMTKEVICRAVVSSPLEPASHVQRLSPCWSGPGSNPTSSRLLHVAPSLSPTFPQRHKIKAKNTQVFSDLPPLWWRFG